jgi:hypothetical protein
MQHALFRAIQSLIPDERPVILLGDGDFDGSRVLEWLETGTTWQYVCRTTNTTLVWYQGRWIALKDFPLTAGQGGFLTGVRFTQSGQVGPVNILVVWNKKEGCHWFFVTNFDTQAEAQKWYGKRATIETLFSDVKDRGFHLADTRLWHPERVSRLIMATAIAYIFSVCLGVEALVSRTFTIVKSQGYTLVRCFDLFYPFFLTPPGDSLLTTPPLLHDYVCPKI